MTTRGAALMLLALAGAAPAGRARAEDVPACANIEEPLAYNACLAVHGPKANASHASAAPNSGPIERARPAQSERRAPLATATRRHGRSRMEFFVR